MFDVSYTQIITYSFFVWATIAFGVTITAFIILFRQRLGDNSDKLSPRGMLLLSGIALSWLGEGLNKTWFGLQRIVVGDNALYYWMKDHWIVWIFTLLVMVGGMIHFQMLARRYFGTWAWMFILSFSIVVVGTIAWFD